MKRMALGFLRVVYPKQSAKRKMMRPGILTMRRQLWAALALFGFMAGTMGVRAGAQAQTQPQPAPMDAAGAMGRRQPAPPAGPLKITYGDQSAEWTADTLAALPHTTVSVYNEHTKASETYSGVPLIDLLVKLGVPDKPHGKQFRIYLVAVGSDGYEVVYSLGEVTPDVSKSTVLVADSEDGKPITQDGPLKMIATGEKRPARWVRNLVAIRVLTAE
jgi:hypothetical protein